MEWMQAALEAGEEEEDTKKESDDSVENVEQFQENLFKENKDLIKFGREHLNRIKKYKDENKIIGSNKNTINKQPNVENVYNYFTLQTNPQSKETTTTISYTENDNSIEEDEDKLLDSQTIPQNNQESEQTSVHIPFQQVPKGKEWKGYENCTSNIYGDDVFRSIPDSTAPKLVPFNEELRSIHFNLPSQVYTTSDGHVIQNTQVRRTQKRKHQINWLAMEAQEHEFDLLQQTAHMRKSKRETQMKYGW